MSVMAYDSATAKQKASAIRQLMFRRPVLDLLTQKAEKYLEKYSFGKVLLGMGHLFCHVSDGVRGANREGAVENAQQESNAPRPSCSVILVERCPHEVMGRMLLRHDGKYDDGDDAADQDEPHSRMLSVRCVLVGKDHEAGRPPESDEIADVDVEWLADIVIPVPDGIHAHSDVA